MESDFRTMTKPKTPLSAGANKRPWALNVEDATWSSQFTPQFVVYNYEAPPTEVVNPLRMRFEVDEPSEVSVESEEAPVVTVKEIRRQSVVKEGPVKRSLQTYVDAHMRLTLKLDRMNDGAGTEVARAFAGLLENLVKNWLVNDHERKDAFRQSLDLRVVAKTHRRALGTTHTAMSIVFSRWRHAARDSASHRLARVERQVVSFDDEIVKEPAVDVVPAVARYTVRRHKPRFLTKHQRRPSLFATYGPNVNHFAPTVKPRSPSTPARTTKVRCDDLVGTGAVPPTIWLDLVADEPPLARPSYRVSSSSTTRRPSRGSSPYGRKQILVARRPETSPTRRRPSAYRSTTKRPSTAVGCGAELFWFPDVSPRRPPPAENTPATEEEEEEHPPERDTKDDEARPPTTSRCSRGDLRTTFVPEAPAPPELIFVN